MSAVTEKMLVAGAILSATVIFGAGVWTAIAHCEPHNVNRAGALIVCVEGLLIFVEFARRTRLRAAEEHFADNPYLLKESIRAERQIIGVGVMLAVAGEFLHGFGDVLFDLIIEAIN
jgi:hypothetical protein